jgi:hypothetical protein
LKRLRGDPFLAAAKNVGSPKLAGGFASISSFKIGPEPARAGFFRPLVCASSAPPAFPAQLPAKNHQQSHRHQGDRPELPGVQRPDLQVGEEKYDPNPTKHGLPEGN